MIETSIRVTGEGFHGRYVKPAVQGEFVRHTLQAARDAARFRTFRASRLQGRPFRFLQSIWDIEQCPWLETDRGETLLVFRAHTLESAAPSLFEQESLFEEDRLHKDWTVFDLLGQVLGELHLHQSSDLRLDYGMLESVRNYAASFKHGLELATFDYRSDSKPTVAVIDSPLVEKAGEALHNTPTPRRIRVSGLLDMLRMSNRLFQLILDDGSKVRGVWAHDTIVIRSLLGERVLMEGEASFRSNGDIVALRADAARLATKSDDAFSRKPAVKSATARLALTLTAPGGFGHIVGKWPGNESDREIAEYLTAIS